MSAGRHRGEPSADDAGTMLAICDGLILAVEAAETRLVMDTTTTAGATRAHYRDAAGNLRIARTAIALAATDNYGETST